MGRGMCPWKGWKSPKLGERCTCGAMGSSRCSGQSPRTGTWSIGPPATWTSPRKGGRFWPRKLGGLRHTTGVSNRVVGERSRRPEKGRRNGTISSCPCKPFCVWRYIGCVLESVGMRLKLPLYVMRFANTWPIPPTSLHQLRNSHIYISYQCCEHEISEKALLN